jgi:hypothetical protein
MIIQYPRTTLEEKIDKIHNTVLAIADTVQQFNQFDKSALYYCAVCNNGIFDGNACVDISRMVEYQQTHVEGKEVTVIDADVLGTLCAPIVVPCSPMPTNGVVTLAVSCLWRISRQAYPEKPATTALLRWAKRAHG